MDKYLETLVTETVNERTKEIDCCETTEILQMINREDTLIPEAVAKVIPDIALAVDMITDAFMAGGRLFYFGAGTSGRLGILDAYECPPTFGVDPSMVQGYIAGGDEAIRHDVEDCEDNEELGRQDVKKVGVTASDVVVGIAASGRTPYVLGAVRQAADIGARTIGITNNPNSLLKKEAEICIAPVTGPEALTGSTRMKAGTSQKMVLNMLTTASMIKLGKVYGNRMVDLCPTNGKLVERAKRIFRDITDASDETAEQYLAASGMKTKLALMMFYSGLEAEAAQKLLDDHQGNLKNALANC